jgi:microcystin-dependent protein
MSDPFVAEIRIFPFNFAPLGWAQCDGQLLPISQNTALFSLLGTFYGGDGKSTFALPNLQDSVPVHTGNGPGPGLSNYFLGQQGGSEAVTLINSEMPFHTHTVMAGGNFDVGDSNVPTANIMAKSASGFAYAPSASLTQLNMEALSIVGADLPHNNLMPYLVLNFCIAMQGTFPARP